MRSAPACIFCQIIVGAAPASHVAATDRAIAFMDIRPWRRGHLLVVPRVHGQRVGDHAAPDLTAVFALATQLDAAVRASGIPCDDVNLLVNDGPAAGQTVFHLHVHVVPRVRGDLWRAVAIGPRRLFPPAARAQLDRDARLIAAAAAPAAQSV
ncbi:MAG: HIT domain-containing protein [Kofleriaceae bacterium]